MNEFIFKDNLETNLKVSFADLLKLAEIQCWNKLSPKFSFILSNINEFEGDHSFERRRSEIKLNSKKEPQSLETIIDILRNEYSDLYDINLYIFKVGKKETIIEIQYFRKSNLDPEYFEKIKDNPPMFHAKIARPIYAVNEMKFDINWRFGGWKHWWKTFIYKHLSGENHPK
ncbi:hypothetical protein GCM10023210_13200 [Chryseobacterium ginsengisoli]|uniref:Uncharacterized protein n=1 Tax=Chryseobacterium ginsengisoli TaxID=363853 RepID=A0ABP9M061_9FLAO